MSSREQKNPTASEVVYLIVLIVVMVILIGIVLFGLGFVLFLYGGYVRENQWDGHTVITITADIAVTLFLANEIRTWTPVNLIVNQILIFLGYSVIRAWISEKHY